MKRLIVTPRPIKRAHSELCLPTRGLCWLSLLLLLVFSPAGAQKRIVFTPQWMPQAQFAGYYVAKEKGFYKEEGLNVDIVPPSPSSSALSRIHNNECQYTTMQLCQAMQIIDQGVPLVNILQTSMNNSTMIVSRNNKNPLKLKGARVAKWKDFGQMAVCMGKKEGLDYEWIPVGMSISLFIKGAYDAMLAMTHNEYYQLLQAGMTLSEENICRLSDCGYNVQDEGVYTTGEYYRNHKQEARKFAKASRKGWEWAAQHPKETVDIVMKYTREHFIGTNHVMQELMLKEVLRLQVDKQSGKREFRLRPDMVKKASDLMVECNLLNHEVKYEQLIMH